MSKKTFVYIAICAVIIILAFVIGRSISKRNLKNSTGISSNTATYYCEEGTIQATFASSSVALSFSDGRTMNLPQTISASGARYEADGIVFWNEGDDAFVTEGTSTAYSNCVAGIEKSINASTTNYTDASKTFSFSFPSQFPLFGELGYSQDWVLNSTSSGLLLAEVMIPKSFEPGTNFGESKFTIGVSSDPDAVSQCLTPQFPNMEKISTTTVNGTQFTKFIFSDAGAGNFYDTTSYRTIYNGGCYAIEYTIHSGNIDNYPPGTVTAFDENKIRNIFENMAQSFRFLGEVPGSCGNYQTGTVTVNNLKISVEISDTLCKQELGLSGRNSLADDTGMIFVFPKDSDYAFWMKDMNFPLDMVWVSADFHIVGIEKNVMPRTYDVQNPDQSQTFGGNYIAQYVIELPAGYADKNNLQVGNKISFSEKTL